MHRNQPPEKPSESSVGVIPVGLGIVLGVAIGAMVSRALAPKPAAATVIRGPIPPADLPAPAGALADALADAGADAGANARPTPAGDGGAPPTLRSGGPANPLAVARLLSLDPSLAPSQIPQVLGASIEELVRDKSSVLYAGAAKTKAAGAADSSPAKAVSKSADAGGTPLLAWALAQLGAEKIGCAEWTALGEPGRTDATLRVFYGPQPLRAAKDAPWRPSLPASPEDLRDVINAACGLPPGPRTALSGTAPVVGLPPGDLWWSQMQAAGVSCAQWVAADPPAAADGSRAVRGRINLIQSLAAQGRLGPLGPWSDWEAFRAIEAACARERGTGVVDPAASVRARLGAVLDCGRLGAQDKLEQIGVIQRAFPELSRDSAALYRLALARYDRCNPSPQAGWVGDGGPNGSRAVLERMIRRRGIDVLNGDTAGVSDVQWVRQGPYMPADGPDLFDAVQGTTGDCYLIAALASLAWVRPAAFMRAGAPSGPDRRRFLFGSDAVEVSERTACRILGDFYPLFAHGVRLDANWAGVFEKAYAAWRTADRTDRPDVRAVAGSAGGPDAGRHLYGPSTSSRWGQASPVADIIGGREFWYFTASRSADAMIDVFLGFCSDEGRVQSAMVASTWDVGEVERSGVVPQHAYSVLGVGTRDDGARFVVLRNPWGFVPTIIDPYRFVLPSRWLGRLNLNSGEGGCFALEASRFRALFQFVIGSTPTTYP